MSKTTSTPVQFAELSEVGEYPQVLLPPELELLLRTELEEECTRLRSIKSTPDAVRDAWNSALRLWQEPQQPWVSVEVVSQRWCIKMGEGAYLRAWKRIGDTATYTVKPGEPRKYRSSRLPLFQEVLTPEQITRRSDTLVMMYQHATDGWKQLTDTRFKLLGLVPAVSVLAWSQLFKDLPETIVAQLVGLGIAAGGYAITEALRTYDRRNDELYDELISRCRYIENELGIDTGLFRGRPDKQSHRVNHGWAVATIYRVVKIGWGVSAVLFMGLLVARLCTCG